MADAYEDNLRDRQENELQALQAIYMDDCKDLREEDENMDDWRPPEIQLHLTPLQSMGGSGTAYTDLCLGAKMTVDYPNTPPELKIVKSKGISAKQVNQLEDELKQLASERHGEEMMFDLAQHVQTFLHEHNKPPMGSFYDVMVKNKQAAAQKLEEERKRQEERDRETIKKRQEMERRQIEDVISRRSEEQKRVKRNDPKRFATFPDEASVPNDSIAPKKLNKSVWFTNDVTTSKEDNSRQSTVKSPVPNPVLSNFLSVNYSDIQRGRCLGEQSQSSGASVYLGTDSRGEMVAIHEWKLHCRPLKKNVAEQLTSADATPPTVRRRIKQVESIEQEFKSLQRLQHPNLVHYLGINHQQNGDIIDIEVVTEYVAGYSLSVLIQHKCQLAEEVVQAYARQLLEALHYLHSNAVVHKNIKASSVFVDCKGNTRLADYCIYRRLADLYHSVNFDGKARVSIVHEAGMSKKRDIYKLGLLLVSLVCGKQVQSYQLEMQAALSYHLKDFLMKCLDEDERYRPSAQDLLKHPFVAPDVLTSLPPLDHVSESQTEAKLDVPDVDSSFSQSEGLEEMAARASHSRLFSDFEEVEMLGKGAFGEVFKVTNRLDKCYYAIKRIRIRISLSRHDLLKRILSEVTLLSRLNHENIVRYFNSWIEEEVRREDLVETDVSSTIDNDDDENPGRNQKPKQNSGKRGVKSPLGDKSLSSGNIISFQAASSHTGSSALDVSIATSMSPPMQFSTADDIFQPHFSSSDDDSQTTVSSDDIVFSGSSTSTSMSSKPGDNQKETNDSDSDSRAKKPGRATVQYLYIQMEFCGQDTLQSLIEKGLYRSELKVWRVFREIVEGLAHVHRQGIIHRDLKPVNIFLDSRGRVKIGDFGLATRRTFAASSHVLEPTLLEKALDTDEVLTGQVGTALYISPELGKAKTRTRYSQKVDIYSLGIIFFEMCHAPFNTTMERIRVISNLRREEVIFPPGFEDNKPKETAVIRELLNHNPYDRPSSEDVLHSDYMPLNMEDSQLHEVLKRTLASSNTTRYRDMMAALFSQQPSAVVDYTYDMQLYQTGFSTLQAKLQQNVRERLAKLCSRHGAVEVRAPLLLPNNSIHQKFDNRVQVMDAGGCLLTLPYDFRVPFARLLARSRISNLKRYCLGQVYRDPRMHDAHPKEPWECAFDIVTVGPNRLVPDAEVIYLVGEVINEFPPLQISGYSVLINHTSMLSAILYHCSVPVDQHVEVCNILWDAMSGKLRWEQTKKQLSTMGLSESTVGSLENFMQKQVPIHQVRSIMAPVFKDKKATAARARDGLNELETITSHLKAFGLVQDVVVWLGLAYKLSQFSGVMFLYATGATKQKRHHGPLANVLAAGGRYDKLISDFQSGVLGAAASCAAVGVSIAVDKIVNAMAENEETGIPGVCDVLVYSVRSDPLNECIQIVRDLWTAGVSSQLFENSEQLYSLDDLQTRCKDLGISHIVLLTERIVYEHSTVRVRSLEKDKVVDKSIPRSELIDYLQSRITNKPEVTEVFQSAAVSVKGQPAQGASGDAHSSSQLPIGVTVLTADKTASNIKRRYQSLALSKASQVLQSLSNRQNVEVLAVDLPQPLLSDLRLILNAAGKEDQFTAGVRGIVDKYSLRSRAHVQYLDRLIETIRDLRNGKKKTSVVLLYSISDDRCEILL